MEGDTLDLSSLMSSGAITEIRRGFDEMAARHPERDGAIGIVDFVRVLYPAAQAQRPDADSGAICV